MTERADGQCCAYCGLPLPEGLWRRRSAPGAATDERLYCCLGCRLAEAIVQEQGEAGAVRGMLTRLGLAIFCTMNVVAFTMALWTTDLYGSADPNDRLLPVLHDLFRHVALLFSIPVAALLGIPLVAAAWSGLRSGRPSTDVLLALGVTASFVVSLASVARGEGPIYFEVGCVILVMTTLGRWLEATGRLKASSALDALTRLLPATVRRVDSATGESIVPIGSIEVGDRLRVLPGERFPADGRIERNSALVDEHLLTGESRPVLKEPGSTVLGGTLDLDGDLIILVDRVAEQSTLARVIELVREARLSKGRYQKLVDRVSAWFLPIVATVAVASFFLHASYGALIQGLMAALAVSLIACPCALGLATPLAVWSAVGRAAVGGVLVRSGEAMERLAEVRAIRFDKTGTLTTGTAEVRELITAAEDRQLVLSRAAALAAASSHALARAIVEMAEFQGDAPSPAVPLGEIRAIPGRGVVGRLEPWGTELVLGSLRLMEERGLTIGPWIRSRLEAHQAAGGSATLVGWDGAARGLFLFEERWRPGVREVMERLLRSHMDVGILTGDSVARGRVVARELGVEVAAEMLPQEKAAEIHRIRDRFGVVAMVGDGVNDAPALAASDVGIALGCGTDVSRDSAAVCLLGDELAKIPWTIDLARRTVRTIRQNLAWAFGYNAIGMIVAASGRLNPALAALLMVLSSAAVIANSLRLAPADGPEKFQSASDADRGAESGRGAGPQLVDNRAFSSGPRNNDCPIDRVLEPSSP